MRRDSLLVRFYIREASNFLLPTSKNAQKLQEEFDIVKYPTDMVSAHNAIGNHRWDPTFKRHKDKRGDKSSKSTKDKEKNNSDKPASLNLSFAQYAGKGICYCCGQKHAFQDCPKKDTYTQERMVYHQDQGWPAIQSSRSRNSQRNR